MDTRLEYDVFDQMVERLLRPLSPLGERRRAKDGDTDAATKSTGKRPDKPARRR